MSGTELIVDKTGWGDGPWMTEPDRVDFVHGGLACFAIRHPEHGHYCGYVGVPREHPAYGKPAREVDAEFHGDLNYAAPCEGSICHTPEPGMADDVWWLGGDFGHAFDLCPGREARLVSVAGPAATATVRALREKCFRMEVYRDLPYVRHEIEHLAEQLAAMYAPEKIEV